MKSRDFCYWLQGMFELAPMESPPTLNAIQVDKIRKHLALVFKHEIDPEGGDAKAQAVLNAIHSGKDKVQIGSSDPHDPNILYRC